MQTQVPVVTSQLAAKIAQSKVDHMVSWLGAMRDLPGNPLGIELQQFGDAIALLTKGKNARLYNRVMGLSQKDQDKIIDILRFYRENHMRCWIEVDPYRASQELLAMLASQGLFHCRFLATLYGLPKAEGVLPTSEVAIRTVETEVDLDTFVKVDNQSFGEMFGEGGLYGEYVKLLHGRNGWRFYLAYVDNTPAAMGALYMQNQVASLVGAATIPQMRRRGCQTTLLRQRIADATKAGCELIVGGAGIGTVSQNNMEKQGLRIAYTQAYWREPSKDDFSM